MYRMELLPEGHVLAKKADNNVAQSISIIDEVRRRYHVLHNMYKPGYPCSHYMVSSSDFDEIVNLKRDYYNWHESNNYPLMYFFRNDTEDVVVINWTFFHRKKE